MAKPSQEITKTEFRTNYNIVKVCTTLTDIMQQLKSFKGNNQAVAFGVRKTGSDQAPAWFREFATKVETFMDEQKKFNEKQEKFNETIVRLNNLKTE